MCDFAQAAHRSLSFPLSRESLAALRQDAAVSGWSARSRRRDLRSSTSTPGHRWTSAKSGLPTQCSTPREVAWRGATSMPRRNRSVAWRFAVGGDLNLPEVEGPDHCRCASPTERHRLQTAAESDIVVAEQFTKVIALTTRPLADGRRSRRVVPQPPTCIAGNVIHSLSKLAWLAELTVLRRYQACCRSNHQEPGRRVHHSRRSDHPGPVKCPCLGP